MGLPWDSHVSPWGDPHVFRDSAGPWDSDRIFFGIAVLPCDSHGTLVVTRWGSHGADMGLPWNAHKGLASEPPIYNQRLMCIAAIGAMICSLLNTNMSRNITMIAYTLMLYLHDLYIAPVV